MCVPSYPIKTHLEQSCDHDSQKVGVYKRA